MRVLSWSPITEYFDAFIFITATQNPTCVCLPRAVLKIYNGGGNEAPKPGTEERTPTQAGQATGASPPHSLYWKLKFPVTEKWVTWKFTNIYLLTDWKNYSSRPSKTVKCECCQCSSQSDVTPDRQSPQTKAVDERIKENIIYLRYSTGKAPK